MESKNYKLPALLAISFIVLAGTIGFSLNGLSLTTDTSGFGEPVTLKYHSLVQIYKNGELIDQTPNVLTNIGKEMIEAAVGNPTSVVTNATFQALGNTSSPAVGDTSLAGEITNCGLAAKGGSYSSNAASNGNWTLSSTWTSTCNNEVVNTTALYNYTSGTKGSMFAGTNFTSTTLSSSDSITVNYTVWVA